MSQLHFFTTPKYNQIEKYKTPKIKQPKETIHPKHKPQKHTKTYSKTQSFPNPLSRHPTNHKRLPPVGPWRQYAQLCRAWGRSARGPTPTEKREAVVWWWLVDGGCFKKTSMFSIEIGFFGRNLGFRNSYKLFGSVLLQVLKEFWQASCHSVPVENHVEALCCFKIWKKLILLGTTKQHMA